MTDKHTVPFLHRLHVHGWLIMLMSLVTMAIALRYWGYLPETAQVSSFAYLGVATFSQMSLLALIVGIISLPLVIIPFNTSRRFLYAVLAALIICALIADTVVFAQYRFHINAVVFKLVTSGDVIEFSLAMWVFTLSVLLVLLAILYALVRWLDSKPSMMRGKKGTVFSLLAFLALLVTHGVHVWAAANGVQPVTMTTRYLPLFQPTTANRFMEKQGWIDAEALQRKEALSLDRPNDLKYPANPLTKGAVSKPVNIMLIVIDAWRADSFSAEVTPTVWDLAGSGTVFNDHYSTGNSTRAGIFGLFYGIPSPYWNQFLASRQPPVLMQRLQELGYEPGIFASAKLTQPEFNSTVFADIQDLRIRSEGATPSERDIQLTNDWQDWYQKERKPGTPTFSFLFYDSPHGYDFPQDYPRRFEPMLDEINYLKLDNDFDPLPMANRYRTSVHFTDSLIAQVLESVEAAGDLENTVIIVTGDHGQEFNDNQLNFWGHNSNFTDYQVKVPFIMIGPGVPSSDKWSPMKAYTSHEDLAPTLLKNYLGLSNPTQDYATGLDLFATPEKREWRMAARYSGYAIIEDDSILEVTALGQYDLLDRNNRPLKDEDINFKAVQEALDSLRRFYQ